MSEMHELFVDIKNYVDGLIVSLQEGSDTVEGFIGKINSLCKVIVQLETVMDDSILIDYREFLDSLKNFCMMCQNSDFIVENADELLGALDVFSECMSSIDDLYSKKMKKCKCCNRTVIFRRLPSFYTDNIVKNGGVLGKSETLNSEEYLCPACGSSDRDRMIVSYLEKNMLFKASESTSLLQIAPSKSIEKWIVSECPHIGYETTDLYMEGVSFKSDIQDMNEVPDDKYDIIICSHVLEHVPNDRKALAELRRILKDDGQLIFLVPIDLSYDGIDEEWGLSPEENWKRFGQDDHCRKYGKQALVERLEEFFVVNQMGKDYFGEELFKECGLTDTSVLYVLTKKVLEDFSFEEDRTVSNELLENGPLVTVLLPCYNHEKYVAEAIESVINQTYKNIEFIIGDDGSTDSTPQIMRKYSEYYAKAIYSEVNTRGAYFGGILGETKGKYIALMHSDDVWELDKIAKQVAYMEAHEDCGVCLSWCKYTDENLIEYEGTSIFMQPNRTREDWMRYFWEHGNALCNPSSLVRRSEYIDCARFGGTGRQLPDFFKWIDFVQRTNIYVYPEVLIHMRRYKNGNSENTSAVSDENMARCIVEDAIGWLNVIRFMDDDFFKKSFGCYFVNPDACTSKEIMCEKMFLMLNSSKQMIQHNGLIYYTEIYMDVYDVLETKYNYKVLDYQIDEYDKGLGKLLKHLIENQKE